MSSFKFDYKFECVVLLFSPTVWYGSLTVPGLYVFPVLETKDGTHRLLGQE
jgi:hypothetical protein